ncbi:MAG: hypothetical protein V1757_10095 [Actinomycetota bacterium]
MNLTALLAEIGRTHGPITTTTLTDRLAAAPGEVAAMVSALRAAGMIATVDPVPACPDTASCSATCPGPARCPFVPDLGDERLALRVR